MINLGGGELRGGLIKGGGALMAAALRGLKSIKVA